MMSIIYIFWMYVVLFSVVGAMRGWAKELLVSFSVILALTTNHVLRRYIPLVEVLDADSSSLFWIRSMVVITLVFFGYQTVVSIARLAARAARERLQDTLFGIFMGAINGYLIAGTIIFYLHDASYPYPEIISPPTGSILENVETMMNWMPPHVLGEPGIYFAVLISFIFVIVVFI
ncbi:MAG: CvpA family protein [Anaerolineae bacterium]|nr:CvpA family protein [Anaerolineae bacterium]MDK1080549.1 CvpA family protein [Anaerolineae bacterium]MDK1117424.1 CvpA family protein [Anaerolineae bacterium]